MKLTISRTIALFGIIVSLGLTVSIAIQTYALNELKINGPEYQKIIYGKDLVADILPPPLFLVEAYMLANEAVMHPERAGDNYSKIQALRKSYQERRAYWAASSLEGKLKQQLAEKVLADGDAFWTVIEQQMGPAISRGETQSMRPALDALMATFYRHQASVTALVATSTAYLDASEAHARTQASSLSITALVAGFSSVALFIAGLYYVRRRAIVPLDAMKRYMGNLSQGDYSKEVPYADRTDEIGAMSQAVAIFRRTAVEREQNRIREEDAKQAEIERERRLAREKQAEDEKRQQVIAELTGGLEQLSDGNLTYRIDKNFAEAYEKLRLEFNASIQAMFTSMTEIAQTTGLVRHSSAEIARAIEDLSGRTENQAATIEQTAAAIEEITANVKGSSERAREANAMMGRTRDSAGQSTLVVREAIDAMEKIARSSSQIDQIIGMISDIAFQTNLLALNAGVEAARAGDAGKGFAVVAQEVRELASRSAKAAKEINTLISVSSEQVANGVSLVNRTGDSLREIEAQVMTVTDLISEIVTASSEQASAIAEINSSVNIMDQVTQQNAVMAEETNSACRVLYGEAEALEKVVGRFQVQPRSEQQRSRLRAV